MRAFWIGFQQTLQTLWRPLQSHLLSVGGTGALAAMVAFGISLLIEDQYTSSVTFFVDRSARRFNLPSGLGGLAQQLGITPDESEQPLEFYAWLASSYPVLKATLSDTVPVDTRAPSRAATVWGQLFSEPHPLDSIAEARAIKRLRSHLHADVDPQTSLITITVDAPSRPVAMWLAADLFVKVNSANTRTRQTRAGNELTFLQGRLEHAAQVLRSAEDDMASFYQKNRQFQSSPVLVFEEERLRRSLDVARQIYLSLTQSAQDAELRAVRDIPALTLIEGPVVPIRRSKPRRLLITAVAAVLGIMLSYARAALRHSKTFHSP